MPADDLMQSHDLCQGIDRGRHSLPELRKSHGPHLVVCPALLIGQVHFSFDVYLFRQVQALFLTDTKAERVEFA